MSSQAYLAMASWAENQGLSGTAAFLYRHSDEERLHMLKLVKFINERGGTCRDPALKHPRRSFKSITDIFKAPPPRDQSDPGDQRVVDLCLKEKDYTTHNFMQWYVGEQIEEEAWRAP
jgi:ferritin